MRILAVKTHAFGDALMTTPAVSGLLRLGHSVTVLAGPSSVDVWSRLPGLEGVVHSPAPCGIPRLLSWSLRNRQHGFDRAIHFGSSPEAARWVRFLCDCEVFSGADPEPGFARIRPAAADYCRIAGVHCDDLKPLFPVSGEETESAGNITGTGPYAVLAPAGAANPREFVQEKRWPLDRWAQVSDHLEKSGLRVFIAGGKNDAAYLATVPGTLLAGRLSWGQSAALIAGAELFAGNDSGPAHLAVASGTAALVIFGPTDPDSLYVKGSINPVRSPSPCSPCYSNSVFPGCGEDRGCMESITVEEVVRTIEEMLRR